MPDQETELRRRLHDIHAPLANLDVDQILRSGRIRARRRGMLMATGAVATILMVVAAVPVAVRAWHQGSGPPTPLDRTPLAFLDCTITNLPAQAAPGAATGSIQVRDMDPTGRYVLGLGPVVMDQETGTGSTSLVVLWSDGTPELIEHPGGETTGWAVNAAGTVVGDSWGGEEAYGWVYQDGERTRLPTPDGYTTTFAKAINTAGDVVGEAFGPGRLAAVVLWPAEARHQPRLLTTEDDRGVSAVAITDDGWVVGAFNDSEGGYVWEPDGTGHELRLPAGVTYAEVTAASGHWAVGSAHLGDLPVATASPGPSPTAWPSSDANAIPVPPYGEGDPGTVTVRWDIRTGEVEIVDLSGYDARSPIAVNRDGDLLLSSAPVVVRQDAPDVRLPHGRASGVVARPEEISDDGTVFAGSIESLPVAETPLPRPTSSPAASSSDPATPVTWHC